MLDAEQLEAARELQGTIGASGLPPILARLYSEHTLLSSRQAGLPSWSERETRARVRDAIQLLDAASTLREAGDRGWRAAMRRAAEILEWLSHPTLAREMVPTSLLAAAGYQLAGYAARGQSILASDHNQAPESEVLRSFLRCDIVGTLRGLATYWSALVGPTGALRAELQPAELVRATAVDETLSALGVVCAALRWGDDGRAESALRKLHALSELFSQDPDPYGWLLARLVTDVAETYLNDSLRTKVQPVIETIADSGRSAFERYLRLSYGSGRVLAWPSQQRGLERLISGESVVLCTPTASGKTTIAELAILQGLFPRGAPTGPADESQSSVAIYLVPSRALAAELESKFSRVLSGDPPALVIAITGMYGGTDWGPTDAWLTTDKRTVLICTYEKGEALIKFLGPLFLNRVRTIVIDEAHNVQYRRLLDVGVIQEDRSLRLELLGARLSALLHDHDVRMVALSAVSNGIEGPLAGWVTGDPDRVALDSYRSMRQVVGRLLCRPNGTFDMQLDELDGQPLRFEWEEGGRRVPYVPNPFPPLPQISFAAADFTGAEKRLRPYFFWAGIHLTAAPGDRRTTVLWFVPAQIEGYAEGLLALLSTWGEALPAFFTAPSNERDRSSWEEALALTRDYFGQNSYQARLLQTGIVMHHGSMPGRLGRLLVDLVDRGIIHLVLATSTLSEGVNLPFEAVLVPSLRRSGQPLPIGELANLLGRAGRPGTGTEGRGLFLLYDDPSGKDGAAWGARKDYISLIQGLSPTEVGQTETQQARSPLAVLLTLIEKSWQKIAKSEDTSLFMSWLESAAPLELSPGDHDGVLIDALDTLDAFLLAAIEEAEQLRDRNLDPLDLEQRLLDLWQRTYARYASADEQRLRLVFVTRGRSLFSKVYPDRPMRRRIYNAGLPPRSARQLLDKYPEVHAHLATGFNYAAWDKQEQFEYVRKTIELLTSVRAFALPTQTPGGRKNHWENILRWWVDPSPAYRQPGPNEAGRWLEYVSKAFTYKFNWSLGSIFALELDALHGGELAKPGLEQWPDTGLPWAAFWLKELTTWGTLDAAASYLLSRGTAVTRSRAEGRAAEYYQARTIGLSPNDSLDPRLMKGWVDDLTVGLAPPLRQTVPPEIPARLERKFERIEQRSRRWRVLPVEANSTVYWLDPAGFRLGLSPRPGQWSREAATLFDFWLDPAREVVYATPFEERAIEHGQLTDSPIRVGPS